MASKGLRCPTCHRVVLWKHIDIEHIKNVGGKFVKAFYCSRCEALLKTEN